MDPYFAKSSVEGMSSPFQKLRLAALAVLLVVVAGTSGLMWLERMSPLDALYMTVITLSTVGFGEVIQLHDASRIFVMGLIVVGVALGGFMVSILGQLIIEGQFKEIVARRKMDKKIAKLKNHFIVAGYGRVGRHVVNEFSKVGASFVVIEKDPRATEKLLSDGILFVQGDATDDAILIEAGLNNATTLISTLPDEVHNVYLTLTARHLNSKLNIIARADFEEGERKLVRAGADHVVVPHVVGGARMAMATLRPNVVDFMQIASIGDEGLMLEEILIPAGSTLVEKSLLESGLKKEYGVTIIGIKHEGEKMILNPTPSTVLMEGDIMILIGPTEQLAELSRELSL